MNVAYERGVGDARAASVCVFDCGERCETVARRSRQRRFVRKLREIGFGADFGLFMGVFMGCLWGVYGVFLVVIVKFQSFFGHFLVNFQSLFVSFSSLFEHFSFTFH